MPPARSTRRRKPMPRSVSRVYCTSCGGLYQQELGTCSYGCRWDCVDAAARPAGSLRLRIYTMTVDQPLWELAGPFTRARRP